MHNSQLNKWQTKKLGEVFEIKPPKKEARDQLRDNDLVSFLPMEDLGILTKDVVATKERQLKDVSGSYTYFSDNDVLLAKITPCFENGKLGIVRNLKNGIGFGSSEYIVFRSKSIIPDYLFYFLSNDKFRYEGKERMSGAVGHKRVTKEFIENYLISFPESIDEQKRIVALLNKIFEKIEKAKKNTEKNLQNSLKLFEAASRRILYKPNNKWDIETLGKVCQFYNGKAHEKNIDKNGEYILVNSKFISSEGKTYKRTNMQLFPLLHNDITLVMSDVPNGKALAKCFIIDQKGLYTLNQRICVIRSNSFNTKYLYYLLNRNRYFLNFDNGENQTNLRKNEILNCPLFKPTLLEQKTIVKKLDSLSEQTKKLEEIYKKKLADLEELKKSVLQKAFTGEL